MKEIDLIIRNSKYYVIWTISVILVDLTKEKMSYKSWNKFYSVLCKFTACRTVTARTQNGDSPKINGESVNHKSRNSKRSKSMKAVQKQEIIT